MTHFWNLFSLFTYDKLRAVTVQCVEDVRLLQGSQETSCRVLCDLRALTGGRVRHVRGGFPVRSVPDTGRRHVLH